MEQNIYLVLEDGTVFSGKSFGAQGEVTGEVVFTTGMVGYLETLTDPDYYGQIVVQTFPLVGNYGVIPADCGGKKPRLSAYIVREWCEEPSNFRCEGSLDAYLKKEGIVGLYDIDTRALTRTIREKGVMNGRIVCSLDDRDAAAAAAKAYRITGAVKATAASSKSVDTPENPAAKAVLWDFGSSDAIRSELLHLGCEVVTMPWNASAEDILAEMPQGVVLSGGPGDPAENTGVIGEIRKVLDSGIPAFGIGLGHEMIALALNGKVMKLKYGHRGCNQPVTDQKTGRVYITSQNCGYAVSTEKLPEGAAFRFVNANDGSCEGLEYDNRPILTVQFDPEISSGPQDMSFLYRDFIGQMKK